MENYVWLKYILALLIGLFVGQFFPSYLRKKAENIATKEDVKNITDNIESVKNTYVKQIENFRSELSKHSDMISRKRAIYSNLSRSLRIFIGQHGTPDLKAEFLSNYAELWIWGSDSVITSVNIFLDAQISIAANPVSIPQDDLKRLYAETVLIMRRDAGFTETVLLPEQYKFVHF
jgi:uncharacterized membrane-anchored protein YhcB (DUF1043 family)